MFLRYAMATLSLCFSALTHASQQQSVGTQQKTPFPVAKHMDASSASVNGLVVEHVNGNSIPWANVVGTHTSDSDDTTDVTSTLTSPEVVSVTSPSHADSNSSRSSNDDDDTHCALSVAPVRQAANSSAVAGGGAVATAVQMDNRLRAARVEELTAKAEKAGDINKREGCFPFRGVFNGTLKDMETMTDTDRGWYVVALESEGPVIVAREIVSNNSAVCFVCQTDSAIENFATEQYMRKYSIVTSGENNSNTIVCTASMYAQIQAKFQESWRHHWNGMDNSQRSAKIAELEIKAKKASSWPTCPFRGVINGTIADLKGMANQNGLYIAALERTGPVIVARITHESGSVAYVVCNTDNDLKMATLSRSVTVRFVQAVSSLFSGK